MNAQRKQVVVDPKRQYQTAVYTVLSMIVLVNGFLLAGVFFPLESGLYVNFTVKHLVIVGVFEALIILIGWWLSIRSTHKMLGPVHAFSRELQKLAEGDLRADVRLRSGDACQEAAENINISVTNLRLRIQRLKDTTDRLEANASPEEQEQLILRLKAELDKFKTE